MAKDFRLEPWLVRPQLSTIKLGSTSKRLSHKVMAVLVCLAERPQQLVRKEELFERVWEGAFTSDEALSTVVYELRKALEDDARNPRYIETIRKSGYRLIAPVSPLNEQPTSARRRVGRRVRLQNAAMVAAALATAVLSGTWLSGARLTDTWPERAEAPAAQPAQIRSLAVRPLTSFTDECRQDFFAEGLTEMLIADLVYLGPLDIVSSVISRSAAAAEDPASASLADAVLEGSVLRTGDRLWISIQLVDSAAGHILWGGTYERAAGDALDLQQDLSREIARQIVLNVAPASGPLSPPVADPLVSEELAMDPQLLHQSTPLASGPSSWPETAPRTSPR